MPAKKYLPDFEACSVALFASLVFMGPLPGRAQQPQARPSLTTPASHEQPARRMQARVPQLPRRPR